ncbi:MAG: hypothetical protein CMH98_04710 [Oceanospirillaceae bacterium]|nr:hypothetical protein [Oceanospirillaceae bacterium]
MDVDSDTFGASEEIQTSLYSTLKFGVYVSGAKKAEPSDAPFWGELMRASAHQEVLIPAPDPDPRVEYHPVDTGFETINLYYLRENQLHKVTAAKGGSVGFDFSKGLPKMTFEFTGVFNEPVDDPSPPAFDPTVFPRPLPFNNANTSAVIDGNTDVVLQQLTLNTGIETKFRDLPGDEGAVTDDRNASAGVTFMLKDDAAMRAFLAKSNSKNGVQKVAMSIQHGKTAGNIVKVAIASGQPKKPREADIDGDLGYQFDVGVIPVTGNDEYVITSQ